MIRVLHIVSIMHRGGIETMLMNYYRNIDRSKVQFDFVEHGFDVNDYDLEIKKLGGKIYNIPPKFEGIKKSLNAITKIVQDNHYNIVHVHMDAMNSFALYAAKKGGANYRISHAHSTSMPPSAAKKVVYYLAKKALPKFANKFYTCSMASSDYLYSSLKNKQKIEYVHNAIETSKFKFQENCRNNMRKALHADGKFIVGHVGNFQYPKNHLFLLEAFQTYLESNENGLLILCGEGELRDNIDAKIKELGITQNVILLGTCENVHEYMQAFDVLVLPSFYEGFPVVTVEAQCSGLPVLSSDTISKEIDLTGIVDFLPISTDSAKDTWAKKIEEVCSRDYKRRDLSVKIADMNFDIKMEAHHLEKKYTEMK